MGVSQVENRRIGLIVPSSNVTVETEIPQILARLDGMSFSFHSSRMRMRALTPQQLQAMNAQRERCVLELGDAGVDVILYACLVAIMASGAGTHRDVELRIAEQLSAGGSEAKVLSSAGAVLTALCDMRARRVALVMPYVDSLARQVVGYLEAAGFEVPVWSAFGLSDNRDVACIGSDTVMAAARSLDLGKVDALVLSCCGQMPSLSAIEAAETEFGLPVLSAATAGVYCILRALGQPLAIPGAGSLLRGAAPMSVS